MSARIFIRNDDVYRLDKEFRYFFDAAIDQAIPVVHAVIPGKMDEDLVRFLCEAKEKTPHLVDIVQHGWMHTNHSPEEGKKYEFGAVRSFQSQREDIRQGLELMRSAFGKYFTCAFVPPYHGYNQQTLTVIKEEKFQIFSAGNRKPEKISGAFELPATISMTSYGNPKKVAIRKATDVVEQLVKNTHWTPISGVVTHHADFTAPASRKELTRLFKLIAALREQKKWQVYLFSDLLSKAKIKS